MTTMTTPDITTVHLGRQHYPRATALRVAPATDGIRLVDATIETLREPSPAAPWPS